MASKIFVFFFIWFLPFTVSAQFYTRGEITYQRTFNLKLAMQLEDQYKWIRQFIQKTPKDVKDYFTLNFNQQKTEYSFQPDSADEESGRIFSFLGNNRVASQNQVLSDLQKQTQQALKKIFERNYLITDSLPRYQWKLEDDIRSIAGYPCRKAITTIDDSVVVVAFYTDQIMVSGGPESFNGLPGMILGLAIPRLYTTWFATKVTFSGPEFKPFDLPKKTETVTRKKYITELTQFTKSWRGSAASLMWRAIL